MMNPTALSPLGQQPSVQESRLFVLEAKASQRGVRVTAAPRNSPLVRVRILARDAAVLVPAVRAGLSGRIARNLRIALKVPPVGVPAATAAARRAALVRRKVSRRSLGHRVALVRTKVFPVTRGRRAALVRRKVSRGSQGRRVAHVRMKGSPVNRGRRAVPAHRDVPVRPNAAVEVRQGNLAVRDRVVDSDLSRMVAGILFSRFACH